VTDRLRRKLFAPSKKERIGAADYEPADFKLCQACEDHIEVAFSAGMQEVGLQPESALDWASAMGRRLSRRRSESSSSLPLQQTGSPTHVWRAQ
jgi:hypothetical protein